MIQVYYSFMLLDKLEKTSMFSLCIVLLDKSTSEIKYHLKSQILILF